MITRHKMNEIATRVALRNKQFRMVLDQIESRANVGEFYLTIGIGNDLVERLRADPYLFEVEVDDKNDSEPAVIRWR